MSDIRKALMEATNSSGGFTVPAEFSNQLLAYIQKKSITIVDLDNRNMTSNVQYIPKVTAGTTAYWPAELATITASNTAYGRITLTAAKIASLVNVSSEILEDNNVDLANTLVTQMGDDLALELDNQVYNGTGSPWYGLRSTASFTNAVSVAGTVNQTAADGTASTVTGGAIALGAVVAAVTEVLKDNHEQPDVSYWNPRTIGALINLTDSTSRPILDQNTFASPIVAVGTIGRLYGTVAKESTQVPINATYGTTAALSASCSDALVGRSKLFGLLGNRRGFEMKQFYHIDLDSYDYQTTARFAFAVKYPNSYCLIRGITN